MQTLTWLGMAPVLAAVLVVPGLAAASLVRDRLAPEESLLVSLGAAATIPALLGALVLPLPVSYLVAGPVLESVLLAASVLALVRSRAWLRTLWAEPAVRLATIVVGLAALVPIAFALLPWDRPSDVVWAGTVVSTRAPFFPGDSFLQYRTAQFVQNRLPLSTNFFGDWFISDRTPLVGFALAFLAGAARIQLPSGPPLDLPHQLVDPVGYWLYRQLSALTNAFAVAPALMLTRRLLGARAGSLGAALFVLSPFVAINLVFTWPKLLVGFFYGCLLYWAAIRERPALAGGAGALAVLAHPIGALYLPGVLVWQAWRRRWRWLALAMAVLVVVLLPWFGWADLIYRHPSRMLTYPLGYFIKDPTNARAEAAAALRDFLRRSPSSILEQRLETLTGTFTGWQFWVDWSQPRVTLYNILRACFLGLWGLPLATFGYLSILRALRSGFWAAALVGPTVMLVLYWGIVPEPIVQEGFQPLAALWIALAAADLQARWPGAAPAVVLLSVAELAVFLFVLVLRAPPATTWPAGAFGGVALLVLAALGALACAVGPVPAEG